MSSPDVPVSPRPASHAAAALPARFRLSPPRLPALSLSNWPVSRRLVVLIAMALVMGVVFGGLRVASAAESATDFARTTQLAVLGEQVTALAQAIENERDLTAALCAASPHGNCPSPGEKLDTTARSLQAQVQSAQAVTNAAAGPVQTLAAQIGSPFPASTQTQAAEVIAMIGHLGGKGTPGIRTLLMTQSADSVIESYTDAIADLFNLNDEITGSSGDALLASEVRTLGSLSRAKDQASQERAILYIALLQGSFGGALQSLTTAQGLENAYLSAFQTSATPTEENAYLNAVNGETVDATQLLNNFLTTADNTQLAPAQAFQEALSNIRIGGVNVSLTKAPGLWFSTMSDTINRERSVEQQLAAGIVGRSRALEQGARQSAELTAAVTAVVLLLVLVLTFVVARSLVDPLRRLQGDALEIATNRLPSRVAELSEATDPSASLEVEPISVHSTDEIGRVARAFDQVHREAVRLAGNEALLRGSLSAMFISLSRRSVPLIERLTRMIDSLEQTEDDPNRLSNLFAMDHLVTRMRRNSENLLVLAGEEPVRKWSEPVPLTDVARAATSEIEQYGRVVLNIEPGIVVSGQAASDIVHLLAEIIENATMFSPRDTSVHVSGQEITSGGVLLEVRDNGVGVSPTRLDEMNWRLDNPPLVDVSVSRHMGLFAVSRLAARHGVRVRLRAASPQGLSALVWLPGTLTGREAVRYADPRPRQTVDQATIGQLRVGGRRAGGRHSLVLRAADGQQDDDYADSALGTPAAAAPAAAKSEWFRAKRPSSARDAAAAATAGTARGTGTLVSAGMADTDDSAAADAGHRNGSGGWADDARAGAGAGWAGNAGGGWAGNAGGGWAGNAGGGWAGNAGGGWAGNAGGGWAGGAEGWGQDAGDAGDGWRTAETASEPVLGSRTSAGLPTRIPGANLFHGAASGRSATDAGTGDQSMGEMPTAGARTLGYEMDQAAPARPTLPRRSPAMARSRLSGFQLGSRQAEGWTSSAGDGS